MITRATRESKLKIKGAYSIFTIFEQLSKLSANPSKFATERKGYEELSRLVVPLILLSLLMSLVLVPAIAYNEIRQDVATKYYLSLGESDVFPSGMFDEAKAAKEITLITFNTIRYMITEKWLVIILAGIIIIPLYALLILIFLFVRVLVRFAYLRFWGAKGLFEKQLTLEAYYAILWGPIGVLLLLFALGISYSGNIASAMVLMVLMIAITVWNWYVYVNSISAIHSFKKIKGLIVLGLPMIASVLVMSLFYVVMIAMAGRVLASLGA